MQNAQPTEPTAVTTVAPKFSESGKPMDAKPTETISEIVQALQPLAPGVLEVVKANTRQNTLQLTIVVLGGCSVLGLAYIAAIQKEWGMVEKIAIPVLAFFGGMLAGKKS